MKVIKSVGCLLVLLALAACGDKPEPLSGASASAAAEPLRVISFNDQSTTAGTPFNLQADGNSGITFHLNRPIAGAEVKAWFDHKPLGGVASRDLLVTATIPGDYLKTPGEYPVELEVSTQKERIPAGNFEVKAR